MNNIEEANTAMRIAWKMALVSIGVTIALTFVYASGGSLANVDWWNWLDIFIMLALALGVYKKSRVSAVALFAYYVIAKIYILIFSWVLIGLPITVVFAYFFFRGIQGAFAYHRLVNGGDDTAVEYFI